MRTIWKYPMPITDEVEVEMPARAQVLTVQLQGGEPCIWAAVDDEHPLETRRFSWRGTGHRLGNVAGYVGSVQLHGGALVFHLFDDGPGR